VSSKESSFSKANRLTKASEYQQVFDSASRFKDSNFLILARPNSTNVARLGLAISKKHLHLAVQRNRLKRLIRESFRQNQAALAGVDIVVMAQRLGASSSARTLRESINRHWDKIKTCAKP